MKKVLISLLALFLVCGCGSAEKEKEELNVAKTLDEVKEMIKEESSMPLVIEKELLQSSDLEKLRNYTKDQMFYVKGDFEKEELMESPYKMKSNFDMTDQSIQMVGVYMQGQEIVINQLLRVEKCSDAYLNDILKDMADSPTLKKETMYFSYLNNDHTYTIHFEVYEAATVTQGDIIRGVALGIQTDQTLKGNVLFSDSLSHNSINKILADNNKDEEAYTGYLAQEESEIQDVFQYETKELSFPISQNFNREVTGMAVEYQVHKTPVYNECVYVLAEVVQSYEKEDNQMGLQLCIQLNQFLDGSIKWEDVEFVLPL